MKTLTEHLVMNIPSKMAFVNITRQVDALITKSGVQEGLVLVNSMHITSSVFINDDESGLHRDIEDWVQRLAPGPAADDSAPGPDYRHHASGEDNGDAHLKNLLVHHQVIVPVTDGRLDLGPWQAVFYCEFDGRRSKRLIIKVLGE